MFSPQALSFSPSDFSLSVQATNFSLGELVTRPMSSNEAPDLLSLFGCQRRRLHRWLIPPESDKHPANVLDQLPDEPRLSQVQRPILRGTRVSRNVYRGGERAKVRELAKQSA